MPIPDDMYSGFENVDADQLRNLITPKLLNFHIPKDTLAGKVYQLQMSRDRYYGLLREFLLMLRLERNQKALETEEGLQSLFDKVNELWQELDEPKSKTEELKQKIDDLKHDWESRKAE